MGRFIWREIRGRPGRVAALGLGTLAAAASFVLLTSAVSTSQLRVVGTVREHFRAAYDILVRPPGSRTGLERKHQLVQANFLSGAYGGITVDQWRRVLDVPGVEVAAPIANLGYVIPIHRVPIRIDRYLDDEPVQLYRVRTTWLANGTSRYPGGDLYVYYTRRHRFVAIPPPFGTLRTLAEVVPGAQEPVPVCPGGFLEGAPRPERTPYSGADPANTYLQCFSGRSPRLGRFNLQPFPRGVGTATDAEFPILLAGIDPLQEARLVGLDRAVVGGRFLREGEVAETAAPEVEIPVIASSRMYVDQGLVAEVERLAIPPGARFPTLLGSRRAFELITSLPGRAVGRVTMDPQDLYRSMLRDLGGLSVADLWTAAPVRYAETPGRLRALAVENPDAVWESPAQSPFFPAPPGNEDVQFRGLRGYHAPCSQRLGGCTVAAQLRVVGRFDPERLPGFSPLSRVPLESYYPPVALPADRASREALGGRPLLPTMNLGDYVSQPPFLFTTIDAARDLLRTFQGADPSAPISAIRVRVAGVAGPDPLSRERIRRVAELIHRRTGLAVDITAGSSPRPMLVELPPGRFGRPRLLLSEPWVEKGVAVRYLEALDRKSLALSLLVLLAAGFFLANGALASVRARRAELGTLLCLGWDGGRLARAVLGELALVGAAAGTAGAGLALALGRALGLEVGLPRVLLVPPVGLALALASGLAPALRAARGSPLDAVRPPAHPRAGLRAVRRLPSMALAELLRLPSRAIVGSAGLLVGAGALAFLLSVELGFRGVLVGTLLGRAISLEVRGVDLLSAALTGVLGAASVADVLALNLRERAPELALLRASGWSGRHLGLLLALEAAGVGALGAVPGAAVGAAAGLLLGGGAAALLSGATAAGGGVVLALLASTVPALALGRTATARALAEE